MRVLRTCHTKLNVGSVTVTRLPLIFYLGSDRNDDLVTSDLLTVADDGEICELFRICHAGNGGAYFQKSFLITRNHQLIE